MFHINLDTSELRICLFRFSCAFRNTPKYNQVKGKGKIVTRHWIEKCYALKKYLPWRRYALDTTESAQPESDVELYDVSLKPTADDDDDRDVEIVADISSRPVDVDDVDNSFEGTAHQMHSSGPDTEDELERVAQSKLQIRNFVAGLLI